MVVSVFGKILYPGFENDTSTVMEKFIGAMRTHNLRITTKTHMLVHHITSFVRRTRVQLRPTSEQALESQHRFFDTLYYILKVNLTNSPVGRQRLLNAVLHYNSCHL